MALAMPIMMMMLTGIFTFSQALYQKLQLAEAVSNGGRVMAAERGATDPCADTTTAIQNAAPGLAKTSITISYNIDGNPYGTSCKTAGGANNPLMPAGTTAQVLATYPCTLSVYGIKTLTCSIGSQVTEAVQ
jgi:Flp pilus assembly protein TadG